MLIRANYARQYEHFGVARHGIDAAPNRIEYAGPVNEEDPNVNTIYQGSIVSLDENGKFINGCPAGTATNKPVPMMSKKNVFDPDVTTGELGPNRNYTLSSFSPAGGILVALPVTSGYEFETTEFDNEVTYKPNDGLVPAKDTKTGKVTKATKSPGLDEPYVGFVSHVPSKDFMKNQRIAFFGNFIPANLTQA